MLSFSEQDIPGYAGGDFGQYRASLRILGLTYIGYIMNDACYVNVMYI